MANLALVTANKVSIVESNRQRTAVAAEAITAGAPVRIDTTAGTFTNSNGTTAPEARVFGIATRTVVAGEALTVLRNGILDGYDLSGMNYDAVVYVSDTDGRLADAAGTVSAAIGRVTPGNATTRGTNPDKLLSVELA